MPRIDANRLELTERVVQINRVSKVVKGGRRFSFSAIVVVGDGRGHVGAGLGKADEVPGAINKGREDAKKHVMLVPLVDRTIPHQVVADFGAARVVLRPASKGTGVIAGGPVRAVLESVGVADILTKSLRTTNPHNVIKATFSALLGLKDAAQVAIIRRMVRDLNFPIEIVVCPIVREADGLAMSSRNDYLDLQQRRLACRLDSGRGLVDGGHAARS